MKILKVGNPLIRFQRTFSETRWDIYAGLCLERRPVICPEMNAIEKAMHSLSYQYEINKSLLSDHEIRKIKDEERRLRLASGKDVTTEDLDAASLETAQDFEDRNAKLLEEFVFASRVTEADKALDRRSVDRLLDKRLIFVNRLKLGSNFNWCIPMVKVDSQTSLRQTLNEFCQANFKEKGMQIKILGNAPCAVYTYKYGKKTAGQLKSRGGKVFILKGYHLEGNLCKEKLNNQVHDDFFWLTLEESRGVLNTSLWNSIKSSHIDENHSQMALAHCIKWYEKNKDSTRSKSVAS